MSGISPESGYGKTAITKEEWEAFQGLTEEEKAKAQSLRTAAKEGADSVEFYGASAPGTKNSDGSVSFEMELKEAIPGDELIDKAKEIEDSLSASTADGAFRNYAKDADFRDPVANQLHAEKILQDDLASGKVERNPEHPYKYKYKGGNQ